MYVYIYILTYVRTYIHAIHYITLHYITLHYINTYRQTDIQIDRPTRQDRQTDRQTDIQTDRPTRQDRQTDRQTDGHTYIHTDRQTYIHTYLHTYLLGAEIKVVFLVRRLGSHFTSRRSGILNIIGSVYHW